MDNNYIFTPRFVKQVSDLEYGSVVTHENYNEKLNLNMEQGDYNTEVLRILFTSNDINNVYRIPYLEKYTDDAIEKITGDLRLNIDQIEQNKKDIAENKIAIRDNTNYIDSVVDGSIIVKHARYANLIEGVQQAKEHTYYGKDYFGNIGFHAVPDGIFAEDISSGTAEINGIYYVPRADSVEESMLTSDVRTKLNRVSITSYNDLSNKPSINGVTLSSNVTLAALGIQPAGAYLTEIPEEYATYSNIAKDYLTKADAQTSYTPIGSYTDLKNTVDALQGNVDGLPYNRVCIGTFTGTPKTGDLLVDL